jgi:hypothetical protein
MEIKMSSPSGWDTTKVELMYVPFLVGEILIRRRTCILHRFKNLSDTCAPAPAVLLLQRWGGATW